MSKTMRDSMGGHKSSFLFTKDGQIGERKTIKRTRAKLLRQARKHDLRSLVDEIEQERTDWQENQGSLYDLVYDYDDWTDFNNPSDDDYDSDYDAYDYYGDDVYSPYYENNYDDCSSYDDVEDYDYSDVYDNKPQTTICVNCGQKL